MRVQLTPALRPSLERNIAGRGATIDMNPLSIAAGAASLAGSTSIVGSPSIFEQMGNTLAKSVYF